MLIDDFAKIKFFNYGVYSQSLRRKREGEENILWMGIKLMSLRLGLSYFRWIQP